MKNRFFETCKTCGGEGWLENPNEKTEEKQELECGECEGKGIQVTPEGEELLKFLEKMKIV